MGRSVSVKIGQREFSSKKAAVDYFMNQRETMKKSGLLREGTFFEELRELYTRFCDATKWDLGNKVIYAFSVDYEARQNDQKWSNYLCYFVQFSPKEKLAFSVRKAVDEITKAATAEQQ